jgi:chromosome segregation ATPase
VSAEAIVAIVSVAVLLLMAVLGFIWRNLGRQIGAVRTDLTEAIGTVKTDLTEAIGTVKTDLTEAIGTVKTDLTEAIGTVKTDLESAANQAHARIEGNIKATEDRLSAQIGTVKTDLEAQIGAVKTDSPGSPDWRRQDLTATRSELTAAIEKQTDRIVEVHRDLRGLGERLARVEANPNAPPARATTWGTPSPSSPG